MSKEKEDYKPPLVWFRRYGGAVGHAMTPVDARHQFQSVDVSIKRARKQTIRPMYSSYGKVYDGKKNGTS